MATTTSVLRGTYELDKTHSTVDFAVRHVGVSTFRASFRQLDARLVVGNEGNQAVRQGSVVVITEGARSVAGR